jgi:hypothetical protein
LANGAYARLHNLMLQFTEDASGRYMHENKPVAFVEDYVKIVSSEMRPHPYDTFSAVRSAKTYDVSIALFS